MSAVLEGGAFPAAGGALRRWWSRGIPCPSEIVLALMVSATWLLFYNSRFWHDTVAAMWHGTVGSASFLVSLAVLALSLQAILVLLLPRRLMRPLLAALFMIAAAGSWFCNTYGAVMNQDMMRNVIQTDRAEASALINIELLIHLALCGVVPAILIWKVRLPDRPPWQRMRGRFAFSLIALLVSFGGLLATSSSYAVFLRQHKPVRYALIPAAPVSSLVGLLISHGKHEHTGPLSNPAGKAQRIAAATDRKPLVVFLVIGETARADNFQLGGYGRPTNLGLSGVNDLVYFPHTWSCGTSTAISVPCLFSPLGRTAFDVDEAGNYTNLLDSLVAAGFDVEWRDNNSGCKGVCARVRTQVYSAAQDPQDCKSDNCYDDVMLEDLSQHLATIRRDTVIVFHQVGSHGPAYSSRYPQGSGPFEPACHSNQLDRCTAQEIVNAYDNTIAYTDSVLTRQISTLQRATSLDSLLLYVSDHGESLGEQGLYLHGLPYGFAPDVQKHVPMLIWASTGYQQRTGLDMQCLHREAAGTFSHDNFYHTVLGATDVRNDVYQSDLDILSACRNAVHAPHAPQLATEADTRATSAATSRS